MTEDLSGLSAISRARRALELIEYHRSLVGLYARVRADAVAEARETMTAEQVAVQLGVTSSAVKKLRR